MSIESTVNEIKDSLLKIVSSNNKSNKKKNELLSPEDVSRCRDLLQQLDNLDISLEILTNTLIGKVVTKFIKRNNDNTEVGEIAKTLIMKWKQTANKGGVSAAKDPITKLLMKHKTDCCFSHILWYLDHIDGARLSITNKKIHHTINNKNKLVVQWWKDLDLFIVLNCEKSLLNKICKSYKANELTMFHSTECSDEYDILPSLEGLSRFWRDAWNQDYADGGFCRWSFGHSDDVISEDDLIELNLPADVQEQLRVRGRRRRNLPSRKCKRCGETNQSKVVFYKIFNKTYCSNCMDHDDHLAMRFLLDNESPRWENNIVQEDPELDDSHGNIILRDEEFSVCIMNPPYIDGCAWFIGAGQRNPSIDYDVANDDDKEDDDDDDEDESSDKPQEEETRKREGRNLVSFKAPAPI